MGHFRTHAVQQKPLFPRAALLISAPSSSRAVSNKALHRNPPQKCTRIPQRESHQTQRFHTARVKSGETELIRGFDDDPKSTLRPCRGGSRSPIDGRNHFLT